MVYLQSQEPLHLVASTRDWSLYREVALFQQNKIATTRKKKDMKQQLLKTAILLLLVVLSIGASAQQQAVVRGTVQDQKGNGLPAVSIALLNAKDSALVKAAVSGEKGEYEIIASGSGNFLLSF